jgi:hypothetical protein
MNNNQNPGHAITAVGCGVMGAGCLITVFGALALVAAAALATV